MGVERCCSCTKDTVITGHNRCPVLSCRLSVQGHDEYPSGIRAGAQVPPSKEGSTFVTHFLRKDILSRCQKKGVLLLTRHALM